MEMCNVTRTQRKLHYYRFTSGVASCFWVLCTKPNFIVTQRHRINFFQCANKKASPEKWHEMLLNAESDRFKLLTRSRSANSLDRDV